MLDRPRPPALAPAARPPGGPRAGAGRQAHRAGRAGRRDPRPPRSQRIDSPEGDATDRRAVGQAVKTADFQNDSALNQGRACQLRAQSSATGRV
jgi:hypothetical protein